jgi:hypothetical protein
MKNNRKGIRVQRKQHTWEDFQQFLKKTEQAKHPPERVDYYKEGSDKPIETIYRDPRTGDIIRKRKDR